MVAERDRGILRELAGRIREWAERPEMLARGEAFVELNALRAAQPKVLSSPEGAWTVLVPEGRSATSPLISWPGRRRNSSAPKTSIFARHRVSSCVSPAAPLPAQIYHILPERTCICRSTLNQKNPASLILWRWARR